MPIYRKNFSFIAFICLSCVLLNVSSSLAQANAVEPASAKPFNEQAIVGILCLEARSISWGNGFAVGEGARIVTACHNLPDRDHLDQPRTTAVFVVSRHYGDLTDAKVIATDPKNDIAILEVGWTEHPAFQLATEQETVSTTETMIAAYCAINTN
ncbi:unnamed protein product, partial [marine sediment metagenome]